jgi:type II secretory pathway pseudopilin PulG
MLRAKGFTYLTALFVVAILAGGLALAGTVWEQQAAREREAELLFIGHQYRRAIGLYYDSTPGTVKRYPRALEDLLKDPRQPATQRYLRKLYPDPLGGKEWGVVKGSDGGVAGVYSLSDAKPIKVAGFKVRDAAFEGAQKYADWKFMHTPAAAAPGTTPPAAQGAAPIAAPPGTSIAAPPGTSMSVPGSTPPLIPPAADGVPAPQGGDH